MISRYEILVENYVKAVSIEAKTMLMMARNDILPAISDFTNDMCVTALNKKALSKTISAAVETALAQKTSKLSDRIYKTAEKLENEIKEEESICDMPKLSFRIKDKLLPIMTELRGYADEAEKIVSSDYWPYPSYADMLFYI